MYRKRPQVQAISAINFLMSKSPKELKSFATADGRAVGKRTGYFQQLISELPGAIQVLDQGPIDDESL